MSAEPPRSAASPDLPVAASDHAPIPENLDAPCNICGRGWPYHHDSCAYKQTAIERDALLAERQQAETEIRLLREEIRLREESQIPVIPRGAQKKIEALEAERQQDKEELRRIAVMANELARDGLMPKGTAVKIRDVALAALGVRGDDAIQVLRGAALAVEEDAHG